jgi:hypothetical protein
MSSSKMVIPERIELSTFSMSKKYSTNELWDRKGDRKGCNWCPWSDSNRQPLESKSSTSTSWATGA